MATENEYDRRKDPRYPVPFPDHFHAGLLQLGEVRPDNEYTGDPNRPGPQKRDPVTGQPVWKISVTDPGESNPRRASFEVFLLSDTEPVPPSEEIRPGVRWIELTGMTISPRIAGQGEYKYLSRTIRATGYAQPPTSPRSSGSSGQKSA
ncbi:hypothetical protein [Nocardia brasiliensis]|uniref:Plasmid replication, integration and excision activator n=1 Tax=Nocardia brasiliensis (strain ATCC 700358 / HUJEG-1) TaxID=1133849 RepID=K0EN07_NOCB7|nr:hypothetical protein [Nocardia brasiliensis]AFT98353.1 hypothetical protein O3I_001955 [Nocardia brasiliensis ATCC 700358]OCF90989.1 hypothetical protein AW168_09265 [Nocardia brasiliensis]